MQTDFNLTETFGFFSTNSLARLAHYDLSEGLAKLGVKAANSDVELLRARYDADQDGKLGFWEFASIFLPIEPTLRDSVERRQAGH